MVNFCAWCGSDWAVNENGDCAHCGATAATSSPPPDGNEVDLTIKYVRSCDNDGLSPDSALLLCDEIGKLRAQLITMREALNEAATLLETIARLAGKKNEDLKTMSDVRGYANSRAGVARTVLAAQPAAAPSAQGFIMSFGSGTGRW
jgi:hypothetical protein